MNQVKESPDRDFLCLDWDDEDPFLIYGEHEHSSQLQELEVIMAPCNYLHKEIDEKGFSVAEECEYDPEKQFEYLTSSI